MIKLLLRHTNAKEKQLYKFDLGSASDQNKFVVLFCSQIGSTKALYTYNKQIFTLEIVVILKNVGKYIRQLTSL